MPGGLSAEHKALPGGDGGLMQAAKGRRETLGGLEPWRLVFSHLKYWIPRGDGGPGCAL